ncbi:MAG TPA: hypothetical protein EYP59_01165 [Thiotrichaceae bacterium]|nr:hypothetical protein [Thiotrichaceae bacterium]
MSDKKRQKVEALYKAHSPAVLDSLKKKNGFNFQKPDAEEVLQRTFEKIYSSIKLVMGDKIILHSALPVINAQAWIFKIAKNTALDLIKERDKFPPHADNWGKQQTDESDERRNDGLINRIESPEPGPEQQEEKEQEKACIHQCVREALKGYYSHGVCPLVVALCELERPIAEIAKVIARTEPETEKLLKKCYNEMRTLKKARGEKGSKFPRDKGILERCREEKADYKAYYNDYETKHSRQEGKGSLWWLLFELTVRDWDMKEIADLINKEKRTAEKTWERCLESVVEEVKKCIQQNWGR